MSRRCESRYTELCNRSSSSGVSSTATTMPYNFDAFEDYWEDASVSFGACPGWEIPVNLCSASAQRKEEDKERVTMEGMCGHQQIMPSDDKVFLASQMNEYMACLKQRRSFPPPMASCVTLSIKEGGRFVLKEMDARPQNFFHAERENGRLRLHLIQPDHVDDEEDDGCSSNGEPATADLEDNLSGEDLVKHKSEYQSLEEEGIGRNVIAGVKVSETLDIDKGMCRRPVCGTENTVAECSTAEGMQNDDMEFSSLGKLQRVGRNAGNTAGIGGCPDVENLPHLESDKEEKLHTCDESEAENSDKDCSTLEKHMVRHIAAESSSSGMQVDVFGRQQQEPFWNVNVSKDAVADLNAWSSKQMFLHQSIARMSPALGLAMS